MPWLKDACVLLLCSRFTGCTRYTIFCIFAEACARTHFLWSALLTFISEDFLNSTSKAAWRRAVTMSLHDSVIAAPPWSCAKSSDGQVVFSQTVFKLLVQEIDAPQW